MAKAKRIKLEKILEEYNIDELELKEIYDRFGETNNELPVGLLDELIKVTISPENKVNQANHNNYSWYRGAKMVPFAIFHGEATWITKSDMKMIQRLSMPMESEDVKKAAYGDKTKFSKMSFVPRYSVMSGLEFSMLKKS